MKIMKNFRFEQQIIEKISEIAQAEHRRLTNQIEVILLEYIKKVENQKPQTP